MSGDPEFDDSPIDHNDVRALLVELRNAGWGVRKITKDVAEVFDRYAVDLGDAPRIYIEVRRDTRDPSSATRWVRVWVRGGEDEWRDAEDAPDLRRVIRTFARDLGVNLDSERRSLRLRHGEPATNLVKLASLAGGSEIAAIFDPHLTDAGLATLLVLRSLGAAFSPTLRLLTQKEFNDRLHENFARAVFAELGATQGALRRMAAKEHQRFFLLANGEVIVSGASLNDLDKNERVRRERGDAEDRRFFDDAWAAASMLIEEKK